MQRVSPHSLREAFRALLASDACYHCASVFDPMSARMAGDLGFEVGILGGSVASLEVLAAPDIALITLSEFVEQAARIGRVATLPVLADADHGYGNALNVMRTVTELERNGIAALTIEDTVLPARFGGKAVDLIGIDEAVTDPERCPEILTGDVLGCFETNVFRVELGSALGFLSVPGELLPEIAWGFPEEDPRWGPEAADPAQRGPSSRYFPQHDADCTALYRTSTENRSPGTGNQS